MATTNIIYTAEQISNAISQISSIYSRIDDPSHFVFSSWGNDGVKKTVSQGTVVPTLFGEKKSLRVYAEKKFMSGNIPSVVGKKQTISFSGINFADTPSINVTISTDVDCIAVPKITDTSANGCSVTISYFTNTGTAFSSTTTLKVTINIIAIGY